MSSFQPIAALTLASPSGGLCLRGGLTVGLEPTSASPRPAYPTMQVCVQEGVVLWSCLPEGRLAPTQGSLQGSPHQGNCVTCGAATAEAGSESGLCVSERLGCGNGTWPN